MGKAHNRLRVQIGFNKLQNLCLVKPGITEFYIHSKQNFLEYFCLFAMEILYFPC